MANKPLLKLPIVKLGEWKHPKHGVVKFTQNDFDTLKKNFEEKKPGYEPYLRYGHLIKGSGVRGGEPAQAHLQQIVQKDDVLYGLFEANNEGVVEEVQRGAYRYGSAEIVLKAFDKKTEEPIGMFLKGHSLTNEPFIPDLPRNELVEGMDEIMLSDDSEVIGVSMELSDFPFELMACSNCGVDISWAEMEACEGRKLCTECDGLLKPRRNEPLVTMQKLKAQVQRGVDEMRNLMWEVRDALTASKSSTLNMAEVPVHLYSEPEAESTATEPEIAETPEPTVEPAQSPEEKDPMTTENKAPEAGEQPQVVQPTEAELALQAEVARLKQEAADAKAEADRVKAEAEAAQAALQAKLDAEEAARLEAEKAEAETRYVAQLSDLHTEAVSKGVPPAMADRARELCKQVRAAGLIADDATLKLSEDEDAISFEKGVFDILNLSEATVELDNQHGEQLELTDVNTTANGSTHPAHMQSRLERLRKMRAENGTSGKA